MKDDATDVTVEVPLDLLRQLLSSAQECIDELEVEIEAKYPVAAREDLPGIARRYSREMATAAACRALIYEIQRLPGVH